MQINIPEVVQEVEAAFARYESALVTNDVAELDALFWHDARTIRFGAGVNLFGIDEIRSFRAGRPSAGLERVLSRTVITTFGHDFATANTLFTRATSPDLVGRQSHSWARLAEGWRIVAAHVSTIRA